MNTIVCPYCGSNGYMEWLGCDRFFVCLNEKCGAKEKIEPTPEEKDAFNG